MNKAKIEWCDYTWNPITGCNNGCPYCYARRIYHRFKKSFKPQFHPDRLGELYKIKKPSRIFVGSVTDFWTQGVNPAWRRAVYQTMTNNPQHQYFILTKRPQLIPPLEKQYLYNFFIGTSVTNGDELWERYAALTQIGNRIFISFEPLLGRIITPPDIFTWRKPDWVIIGGLTGSKQKTKKEDVEHLLNQIPQGIKVFIKNNLKWQPKRQEFPVFPDKGVFR